MRTLLPAIKTAIQGIALLASTADAFVTPDPAWRPVDAGATCIGIFGTGVEREELAGEMVDITISVDLVGFVPMLASGSDAVCGAAGVVALLDAATTILKKNSLSQAGFTGVMVGGDSKTALYQASESQWLVMMSRTFEYYFERSSV